MNNLELVIGVGSTFALLSVACSGLGEWVATLFKMRPSLLEETLKNMLNDPDGSQIVNRMYEKGLVKAVSPPRALGAWMGRSKPSYLSPEFVVAAVMEALQPGGAGSGETTFSGTRRVVADPNFGAGVQQVLLPLLEQSKGDLDVFRQKLQELFQQAMDLASGVYKRRMTLLMAVIASLITVGLNLDPARLMAAAQGKPNASPSKAGKPQSEAGSTSGLREILAARRARQADGLSALRTEIRLTRELLTDQVMTALILAPSLSETADPNFVKAERVFIKAAIDEIQARKSASSEAFKDFDATGEVDRAASDLEKLDQRIRETSQVDDRLAQADSAVSTGIGAAGETRPAGTGAEAKPRTLLGDLWPVSWPSSLQGVLDRLPGWIASVFALTMGAPFSFGLLNQLVDVRLAGRKPDPS